MKPITKVLFNPSPSAPVVISNPVSSLRVNLSTNKSQYILGEDVRVNFSVSEDAYVSIFSIGSDGIISQIFPNANDGYNFIQAGQQVSLPRNNDYRLTMYGPAGVDKLVAIASTNPNLNFSGIAELRTASVFPEYDGDLISFGSKLMGRIVAEGNRSSNTVSSARATILNDFSSTTIRYGVK
ncbi:MAG: DUF4384 domain-containing protein [Deinococcales bacterium]